MSWLTAAQALQVLGVRPQTLYANVSRRKIRAKPDPKDTRRSLYHEVDVRKLARRRGGRRKAETVAAGAIEWGDPILSSALSTVADGRLWYRGMDAVALSENGTLEEIAALLWGTESVVQVAGDGRVSDGGRQSGGGHSGGDNTNASPVTTEPLRRAFVALGTRASGDASSHGRALSVLQTEAAGVLETLVGAMLPGQGARLSGGDGRPRRARLPTTRQRATPLHHRVAASWERASAADVVRRVLVLLADHELNASTFATRVTISTGAPLAAGVLSGLATLSGPLHGQAALGVLELIAGVEREGAGGAVRDWLAQGRAVVGFGHPLYPVGDVRAAAILQQFELPVDYAELQVAVEEVIGERPNVDFALAAMTKVYRLPREAPLILFALARCVGWLAHALEQVTTGNPIRPRARYVGPAVP